MSVTTAPDFPVDSIGLVRFDPWLKPYEPALRRRLELYQRTLEHVRGAGRSLAEFAAAYRYFGFNRGEKDGRPGVWYREWAPKAIALSLIGDFNKWDRIADPLHPAGPPGSGVWERFLPDDHYAARLVHGSRVKVHVHSVLGPRDRIPAYIRRVVQEPQTHHFAGQYWAPPEGERHVWQHTSPRIQHQCGWERGGAGDGEGEAPAEPDAARAALRPQVAEIDQGGALGVGHGGPTVPGSLRIYEAHVGMATEEYRVGTYSEFAAKVLPRIAAAGYNAVQLMAIQEHPYYGSFGYQVSNFFAPSSRFGTPEELKALIDAAHGLGLLVFLDVVHSHAVKNLHEGLNLFDGTDYQYFHSGGRGQHPAWDSLLFDYAKTEVLQFLLSNVRYWLDEFRFDGFRFDGVTSMIYLDHGLGRPFTAYDQYFPPHTDEDAIVYLMLANEVVHTVRSKAVTIAEDVSGLAGMARPVAEGGVGFDYRLAMGVPDYWIKLLKEQRDEQWSMAGLYHTLTNRRGGEKHVGYAESHDQALVGDKTIAFRLMDADMYWHMNRTSQNLLVERGMALHKLIRLITFALSGEAYLNFMGNEFGHPEWIDFPREGNNYSLHYARRQWSLVDHPELRYRDLGAFDGAMTELDRTDDLLARPDYEPLHVHEDQKLLMFRRGPLVFAFNWHPLNSYADYRIGVPAAREYRLILNTDAPQFGGHGLVAADQVYPVQAYPWFNRAQSIQIYLPARTALVLRPGG